MKTNSTKVGLILAMAVGFFCLVAVPSAEAGSNIDQTVQMNLPSFQDRFEALGTAMGQASAEDAESFRNLSGWLTEAQGLASRKRTQAEDFQLGLLFSLIRGTLTHLEQIAHS